MYNGKIKAVINGTVQQFDNRTFSMGALIASVPTKNKSGVLLNRVDPKQSFTIMLSEFNALPADKQKVGDVVEGLWEWTKRGNTFGLKVSTPVAAKQPAVTAAPKKEPVKKVSTKKKTVPATNKTSGTHYVICLDCSGSMGSIHQSVRNNAYKTVLAGIIKHANDNPTHKISATVWQFGGLWLPRRCEYNLEADVPDVRTGLSILERVTMPAHGGTPLMSCLNDAMEHARTVYPTSVADNMAYFVYVITDGQDTGGEIEMRNTQKTIAAYQATDLWTLALQVPRGTEDDIARRLGIPRGNIVGWDAHDAGMAAAANMTSSAMGGYAASRSAGVTRSKSVYTDLSNLSTADLNKLTDLSGKIRHWQVDKECEIREFVESKTALPYVPGTAFYQLTKAEDVQETKSVIIREKNRKKFFGGAEARKLIGILPNTGTVRVHPGNHANYDVFVTSASYNRKLVRGTTVLYMADAAAIAPSYIPVPQIPVVI